MKTKRRQAILALPLSFFAVGATDASDALVNIHVFVDHKSLSNSDWAPVDSQTGYGLDGDIAPPSWPFSIVETYISTKGRAPGATGRTTELGVGVRKYINTSNPFRFYLDLGVLQFARGAINFSGGGSLSSSSPGFGGRVGGRWIGGGAEYMLTHSVSVGFNARLSSTGGEIPSGGSHFGVSLGYHIK